jgi:hypothetical protein
MDKLSSSETFGQLRYLLAEPVNAKQGDWQTVSDGESGGNHKDLFLLVLRRYSSGNEQREH